MTRLRALWGFYCIAYTMSAIGHRDRDFLLYAARTLLGAD